MMKMIEKKGSGMPARNNDSFGGDIVSLYCGDFDSSDDEDATRSATPPPEDNASSTSSISSRNKSKRGLLLFEKLNSSMRIISGSFRNKKNKSLLTDDVGDDLDGSISILPPPIPYITGTNNLYGPNASASGLFLLDDESSSSSSDDRDESSDYDYDGDFFEDEHSSSYLSDDGTPEIEDSFCFSECNFDQPPPPPCPPRRIRSTTRSTISKRISTEKTRGSPSSKSSDSTKTRSTASSSSRSSYSEDKSKRRSLPSRTRSSSNVGRDHHRSRHGHHHDNDYEKRRSHHQRTSSSRTYEEERPLSRHRGGDSRPVLPRRTRRDDVLVHMSQIHRRRPRHHRRERHHHQPNTSGRHDRDSSSSSRVGAPPARTRSEYSSCRDSHHHPRRGQRPTSFRDEGSSRTNHSRSVDRHAPLRHRSHAEFTYGGDGSNGRRSPAHSGSSNNNGPTRSPRRHRSSPSEVLIVTSSPLKSPTKRAPRRHCSHAEISFAAFSPSKARATKAASSSPIKVSATTKDVDVVRKFSSDIGSKALAPPPSTGISRNRSCNTSHPKRRQRGAPAA